MNKLRDDFLIEFESHNFPHARNVPRWGRLCTTWHDVLWAALTVGRPPMLRYILGHGNPSLYEAIFRLSLVWMALEQNDSVGYDLRRTDAFKSLDPTEKGAVNYFLGMAFCKLFATKFLGTPWLLHFDVFRDRLDARLRTGRSRPDLVGYDPSVKRWHAFECKGRSVKPTMAKLAKAKRQAANLAKLDGTAVDLHVATVSYFRRDTLHFYWCDPDPDQSEGPDRMDWELPAEAWRNYFEPVSALIRLAGKASPVADRELPMAQVENLDMRVGAHPEIRPLLLEGRWRQAHNASLDMAEVFRRGGYRPDGLIVEAGESWGERRRAGGDG